MALRPSGSAWVPEDLGVKVAYLTAFGVLNDGELVATSLEGDVFRIDPS
jgi:hypothetical protein